MLELLRSTIEQNAGQTWRVSTSRSATGCRVQVELRGVTFRATGPSVEAAETQAAAKIVEWAHFRGPDPAPGDELLSQLKASVAIVRAKRQGRALRVIKGGKS